MLLRSCLPLDHDPLDHGPLDHDIDNQVESVIVDTQCLSLDCLSLDWLKLGFNGRSLHSQILIGLSDHPHRSFSVFAHH
jgi:hypothetical protein